MHINSTLLKFKKQRIKLTPQRIAILQLLKSHPSHPSAYELYVRLKKSYPSLSLTTVYNTLELLVKMNEVKEIKIDPDKTLYDPNVDPHDHFYCVKCGLVEDITPIKLQAKSLKEISTKGFSIFDIHTSLYGLCKNCASKPNP